MIIQQWTKLPYRIYDKTRQGGEAEEEEEQEEEEEKEEKEEEEEEEEAIEYRGQG